MKTVLYFVVFQVCCSRNSSKSFASKFAKHLGFLSPPSIVNGLANSN